MLAKQRRKLLDSSNNLTKRVIFAEQGDIKIIFRPCTTHGMGTLGNLGLLFELEFMEFAQVINTDLIELY